MNTTKFTGNVYTCGRRKINSAHQSEIIGKNAQEKEIQKAKLKL